MINPEEGVVDIGSSEKPKNKKTFFTDEKGNLKVVNLIVRRPVTIFFLVLFSCIGISMVLVRLLRSQGNPFTEDSREYDIKDVRSIHYDSLKLANDYVNEAYLEFNEISRRLEEQRLQEKTGDRTFWIFEAKTDAGVFTKEGVELMREAESTILKNENYPDYCRLEYSTDGNGNEISECRKPLSPLNIFYASSWDSALVQEIIAEFTPENILLYRQLSPCIDLNALCDYIPVNTTQAQKDWVSTQSGKINSVIANWDGEGDINPNVEEVAMFIAYMNELEIKKQYVSFFVDKNFDISNPVSMHSRALLYWGELLNGTKTVDDSEKKLKRFVLDNLVEEWEKITDENYNDSVSSLFFMGSLIFDLIIGILRSDALKAIGSIIFVFLYLRLMLGSWFLCTVGLLEIVFSIPVSWFFFAYVFQIKYFSPLNIICLFIVLAIGADDIFVFMDSYKLSASQGSDVLESLESRMSWVFRRSGSAMLLTSATTCSAFLCTLANPIASTQSFGIFAAFVIFFDYALVMSLFCSAVVIYHNRFESKQCCCNCIFWRENDPTPTAELRSQNEAGQEIPLDRISRFFKEKVGPFILNTKYRLAVLAICVAYIAAACVYTAKLEPTTTAEQFLADDHPLQRGAVILTDEFERTQNDETSKIYYVWGLEEVDRSGVNQLLDPENVGVANFAEDFTFNQQCQTKMLQACQRLRTDPEFADFVLIDNGLRSVDCFVEELGAYNALGDTATCEERRTDGWASSSWQVDPSEMSSKLSDFVTTDSCYSSRNILNHYDEVLGWDGTSLRYVGISFESSLLSPRTVRAENEVREHYDKFIALALEFDEDMEAACGTKTIMTDLDQKFIFMNNQRIYRTSAVSGAMIGVGIAFAVIFISTRKLHISIFSTLSILSVLVGVIGSVTMLGWTLGTIEAILISILAGFSVDYAIHLAHAYVHSNSDTIEGRITSAYGEMGISVLSGELGATLGSEHKDEVECLKDQVSFLKTSALGAMILSLVLGISTTGVAFGFVAREKTYKDSMQEAMYGFISGSNDFVWTKLGLEQIPFEHWGDFSGEPESSLYIKNLPFPGEDFNDTHLDAWKMYVSDGARIENLLEKGFILPGKEHEMVKEVFNDYMKIPSTYSDPIVIEESLIDYRLQFATDIGSTMIGDTAAKGRLVSPAGRRLREHFYRFPDQCDATPIALEVFLRLMIYDQVEAFFHEKNHDLFNDVDRRPYDSEELSVAR